MEQRAFPLDHEGLDAPGRERTDLSTVAPDLVRLARLARAEPQPRMRRPLAA
jgi:hypothetical protein